MKTKTQITHQQSPKDRCTHSLQSGQYMWNYWRSIHEHIHHNWFHSSNPWTLLWREKEKSHQRWHVNVRLEKIPISIKLHQMLCCSCESWHAFFKSTLVSSVVGIINSCLEREPSLWTVNYVPLGHDACVTVLWHDTSLMPDSGRHPG